MINQLVAKVIRLYQSRKKKIIFMITMTSFLIYYYHANARPPIILDPRYITPPDVLMMFRVEEKMLQDKLKHDKGTGCEIPVIDIFSKVITGLERNATPINCPLQDWVKCYHSECRIVKEILNTHRNILCTYRDIIYVNDNKYVLGTPVDVSGDQPYNLIISDHVKIRCIGTPLHRVLRTKWYGHGAGFRKNVSTVSPPLPPKKDLPNVLIFGYDSLSKNGFIRRLPKTYKYITEDMKLTILQKYNIVGDGTTAALFPILSGLTDLEIPDARIYLNNNVKIDSKKFIFHRVKQQGYRTAFFEDMQLCEKREAGTFQTKYNGFDVQPTDHFLRPFILEEYKNNKNYYCVGSTMTHRFMMNLTEQFLSFSKLKRFIFNFMSVGHEIFDMIAQMDEATMEFLKSFKERGLTKNTLLIFMGDHGSRYGPLRKTFQAHLEERLPLMAVLLPEAIKRTRPSAQKALELNSRVLTTPHDIHATLLDALDLTQYTSDYKIPGADFPRAMSLLKPIPQNRSCSEAGITTHWCTCVSWNNILVKDPMYIKTAQALIDFINRLTEPVRCFSTALSATFNGTQKLLSSSITDTKSARHARSSCVTRRTPPATTLPPRRRLRRLQERSARVCELRRLELGPGSNMRALEIENDRISYIVLTSTSPSRSLTIVV